MDELSQLKKCSTTFSDMLRRASGIPVPRNPHDMEVIKELFERQFEELMYLFDHDLFFRLSVLGRFDLIHLIFFKELHDSELAMLLEQAKYEYENAIRGEQYARQMLLFMRHRIEDPTLPIRIESINIDWNGFYHSAGQIALNLPSYIGLQNQYNQVAVEYYAARHQAQQQMQQQLNPLMTQLMENFYAGAPVAEIYDPANLPPATEILRAISEQNNDWLQNKTPADLAFRRKCGEVLSKYHKQADLLEEAFTSIYRVPGQALDVAKMKKHDEDIQAGQMQLMRDINALMVEHHNSNEFQTIRPHMESQHLVVQAAEQTLIHELAVSDQKYKPIMDQLGSKIDLLGKEINANHEEYMESMVEILKCSSKQITDTKQGVAIFNCYESIQVTLNEYKKNPNPTRLPELFKQYEKQLNILIPILERKPNDQPLPTEHRQLISLLKQEQERLLNVIAITPEILSVSIAPNYSTPEQLSVNILRPQSAPAEVPFNLGPPTGVPMGYQPAYAASNPAEAPIHHPPPVQMHREGITSISAFNQGAPVVMPSAHEQAIPASSLNNTDLLKRPPTGYQQSNVAILGDAQPDGSIQNGRANTINCKNIIQDLRSEILNVPVALQVKLQQEINKLLNRIDKETYPEDAQTINAFHSQLIENENKAISSKSILDIQKVLNNPSHKSYATQLKIVIKKVEESHITCKNDVSSEMSNRIR